MRSDRNGVREKPSGVRPGAISLSIVIPAYNEELSIKKAVEEIVGQMPGGIVQYELLIVDDGSSDRTGEIAGDIAGRMQTMQGRIRLLKHERNLGYGAALRTGISNVAMDWILLIDADRQIAMSELEPFLNGTGENDMLIGYRAGRNDSVIRRVLSLIYGQFVAFTLGLRVKDVNCPFKLFRKDILRDMHLTSNGFLIDAELLAEAVRQHYRWKELKVVSRRREQGRSTVRFTHVVGTMGELLRYLVKRRQHLIIVDAQGRGKRQDCQGQ